MEISGALPHAAKNVLASYIHSARLTHCLIGSLWSMSEYQIMRWHHIPSMVIARAGEQVIKIMLPTRFQEAIDEAAMRMGEIDADAYTSGWNRDPWIASTELAQALADRIAQELEATFSEKHLQEILDELGKK